MNRSQIAEALFNKLSKKNQALSAGLNPKWEGWLKSAHNDEEGYYPPIVPMGEMGYDLSQKKMKKLDKRTALSAGRIIFIFNKKKHGKDIPGYLRNSRDIEFWDVDSIKEGITFEEYYKLERKRIKKIEILVKGLVNRIG